MSSAAQTEVTCKQAYDLLFTYLEGELAEPTARSLEAHLELCPPCRQFVASYRETPGLCREALDADCPPEVTESLQEFLRKKLGGG